jgi:hypothetical protein
MIEKAEGAIKMDNLETVVLICNSSRVLVMNEYFNWKLHDFPENGVLLILRCMSCNIYIVCERYRFCFLNFFSDINSPPLFKNLPQTVSVLEGMTIGSSVYQLQVDFKAPNLPLSLRFKGSGCHYNSIIVTY